MRNSINGAWLLGILLTFMAVFIAYIAITFNYNNAFEIKTKMVSLIEKNNGANHRSIAAIQTMLQGYKYKIKSVCPDRDGEPFVAVIDGIAHENSKEPANYCIYRDVRYADGGGNETTYYYDVVVFFGFSLPVVGDIFTFKVNGGSNAIHYPVDEFFEY